MLKQLFRMFCVLPGFIREGYNDKLREAFMPINAQTLDSAGILLVLTYRPSVEFHLLLESSNLVFVPLESSLHCHILPSVS